jgi:hypothetical protein
MSGRGMGMALNGKIPMHPDDSDALLAWVIAKRSHETIAGKHFDEKPVWFRLIG